MHLKAVIFDLDGVIVSTDEHHYQSWKRLTAEEGIYFDRKINERLRGISRMESLEIVLERSRKSYTAEAKQLLATRKNSYYQELIQKLTPQNILPGVLTFLEELKKLGVKIAIGSSSKNTPLILKQIGLDSYFDAVVDGNDIKRSKPDPEVFLLAAQRLGIPPDNCLVVEDAEAGVEAALAGGMRVLGLGSASKCPRASLRTADLSTVSMEDFLEECMEL
jgi:beta-phosphoglucomutase